MRKLLMLLVFIVIVFFGGLFIWEKFFDKSYLPPEDSISRSSSHSSVSADYVRIIVSLKLANYVPSSGIPNESQKEAIRALQQKVIASLPVGSYKLISEYETFPTIAFEVNSQAMTILKNSPDVLHIQEDTPQPPL